MNILHLTLKKKWFDMIESGEKIEEYREIKPYWTKRLEGKTFDAVQFKNGYSKDAPVLLIECRGIEVDSGVFKWGAEPFKEYYVIKIGKQIK